MNRKMITFSIAFVLLLFAICYKSPKKDTVNVYGWYGIMCNDVLKGFEKETGIKVVYDVYDNNDTLEAKLLATNSGYDVVFPSFIPYGVRQCAMGAYVKLDSSKIPNLKNIKGQITKKFQEAGGSLNYLVPIFWGTIGIAYDYDAVHKVFPNINRVSYDILLDPEKLSKLAKGGVSFPEEYIDIFPQTEVFLKLNDGTSLKTPRKLKLYMDHFRNLRKSLKKFSSNTMISDLIFGEVIVAIGSSDNAWRAKISGKNVGKRIEYTIPKGSGVLWIDCMGVPSKAPHRENAYKFINYLLREDVAAKLTNYSGILVNIPSATKLFNKDITDDQQICPLSQEILSSLVIGRPSHSAEDKKNDKLATRVWSQIRMNEFGYHFELDEK